MRVKSLKIIQSACMKAPMFETQPDWLYSFKEVPSNLKLLKFFVFVSIEKRNHWRSSKLFFFFFFFLVGYVEERPW